jgi:TP901 family phage tail tape measure protein
MGPQMILGIMIRAKDQASQVMGKVEAGMKGLGDVSEETASRFKSASIMFKGGIAMMGAGAATLGGLTALAVKSMGFSSAMAEVSTLVDTTAIDMDALGKSVQTLSTTYGSAPTDTAKALYQTISSGVSDAADATKLLDVANRTAIGGVTDVFTAVDGLTSLMNAYGLSVSEAEALSGQLFIGMRAGKTKIGELSGVIGRVAPIMAEMNVSTGETIGALSALTKTGMSTEMASTRLTGIVNQLGTVSADGVAVWKKLTAGTKYAGTAFDITALQSKGLVGFLQMVKDVVGDDTKSMKELFSSQEAFSGILPLVGSQWGALNDIVAQMGTPLGETQAAYEKMRATSEQSMKRMTASVSVLGDTLGATVAIALQPFMEHVTAIADKIITWAQENPGLAETLMKVALGIGAVLLVGGTLITILGAIGMAGAAVSAGMAVLSSLSFPAMISPLITLTRSVIAFNMALLGNPITWIVLLIAAVIVGIIMLVKHWDKVTGAFKIAWNWIKGSFSKLGDFFMTAWNKVKSYIPYVLAIFLPIIGIPLLIVKHWDQIVAFLTAIWARVKTAVLGAVGAIWNGIKSAFSAGLEFIKSLITGYINIYVAIWRGLVNVVSGTIQSLSAFWQGFANAASSAWTSVVSTVVSVVNRVIGIVNAAIGAINKVSGVVGITLPLIPTVSYHTGFEVARTGMIPAAEYQQGEVLLASDTAAALKGMADTFLGAGGADDSGIAAAIAAATGAKGAEVGATPGAIGGGGTSFVLQQGAVVISFPAVTSVTEIDAEDLVRRIAAALEQRAKRSTEGRFTGEFQPTIA